MELITARIVAHDINKALAPNRAIATKQRRESRILRKRFPIGAVSGDGSGWIVIRPIGDRLVIAWAKARTYICNGILRMDPGHRSRYGASLPAGCIG